MTLASPQSTHFEMYNDVSPSMQARISARKQKRRAAEQSFVGTRLGRLVVVEPLVRTHSRLGGWWLCRCDCGRDVEVSYVKLRIGKIRSCGCLLKSSNHYSPLLPGEKFNRLTVVEKAGRTGDHTSYVLRCDCGELTKATVSNLRRGYVQSCGCLHKELSAVRMRTAQASRWATAALALLLVTSTGAHAQRYVNAAQGDRGDSKRVYHDFGDGRQIHILATPCPRMNDPYGSLSCEGKAQPSIVVQAAAIGGNVKTLTIRGNAKDLNTCPRPSTPDQGPNAKELCLYFWPVADMRTGIDSNHLYVNVVGEDGRKWNLFTYVNRDMATPKTDRWAVMDMVRDTRNGMPGLSLRSIGKYAKGIKTVTFRGNARDMHVCGPGPSPGLNTTGKPNEHEQCSYFWTFATMRTGVDANYLYANFVGQDNSRWSVFAYVTRP